jgi:hypothetical protein
VFERTEVQRHVVAAAGQCGHHRIAQGDVVPAFDVGRPCGAAWGRKGPLADVVFGFLEVGRETDLRAESQRDRRRDHRHGRCQREGPD